MDHNTQRQAPTEAVEFIPAALLNLTARERPPAEPPIDPAALPVLIELYLLNALTSAVETRVEEQLAEAAEARDILIDCAARLEAGRRQMAWEAVGGLVRDELMRTVLANVLLRSVHRRVTRGAKHRDAPPATSVPIVSSDGEPLGEATVKRSRPKETAEVQAVLTVPRLGEPWQAKLGAGEAALELPLGDGWLRVPVTVKVGRDQTEVEAVLDFGEDCRAQELDLSGCRLAIGR